jgi:choline dehydrogenase-like flavoprotein
MNKVLSKICQGENIPEKPGNVYILDSRYYNYSQRTPRCAAYGRALSRLSKVDTVLIDAAELPAGTVIEADVCIIGSGPAGLTLARELKDQPFKVVLVESGGFKPQRKLKELNEGEFTGDPYLNPRFGRSRQLGGTANRWLVDLGNGQTGARFAPLDSIDFEKRDCTPYSGWPISRADLDPFYERANAHCGLGPHRYDAAAWEEPGRNALPFEPGTLRTSMFQFGSKERWTSNYDVFRGASNIDLLLEATVLEVETDPTGAHATGVRAVNMAGHSVKVRAKQVLLAVGCIETSRLLLNSRAVHSNGIGNQHDVVGRYFMDHPQSYESVFIPSDRRLFERTGLYDLHRHGSFAVMAKLGFSEELMRRERLHNTCYLLFPRRDHYMTPAFQSFFSLVHDMKHLSRPSNVGKRLMDVARGLPHLAQIGVWALQGTAHYPHLSQGGWSDIKGASKLFSSYEMWSLIEQIPDPANRITLSTQRDYTGTPLVQINWRFTEQDRENARHARAVFKRELERNGLGTVIYNPEIYSIPSSVHPHGGARMGADPSESVVDATLKVHGVSNLYIVGSAVFPTGGYVNPTLTVVALACRLADQVKHNLRTVPVVQTVRRELVLN